MGTIYPPGKIELLRRARGLSQTALARLAGIDGGTLSRAENGYVPGPAVRAKIAEALELRETVLWPARPDSTTIDAPADDQGVGEAEANRGRLQAF